MDNQAAEELISYIRELPASQVVSNRILDRVPWLFDSREDYISWKSELAKNLKLDPFALIVVGSACTGFSLSPRKLFTPFSPNSDIDVAIISPDHFNEAWRWLRQPGVQELFSNDARKNMFIRHRTSLVFDGTIATDSILNRLPFGPQWIKALLTAANRDPTIDRSIKARVYKDFESLREYHESNIEKIKTNLIQEAASITSGKQE